MADIIKSEDNVPRYYTDMSRDFQFFERLYDVTFNDNKCNIDLIESLPVTYQTDTKFLKLLAITLGLDLKGDYANDDLRAITNTFSEIIRNKGSITGVEILIKTLLKSKDSEATYEITTETYNGVPYVIINIPDFVYNPRVRLIEEVLDYILPIGCLYTIETSYNMDTDFIGYLETSGGARVDKPTDKLQMSYLPDNEEDHIKTENIAQTSGSNIPEPEIVQGDIRVSILPKTPNTNKGDKD